jgi:hypothetical protein
VQSPPRAPAQNAPPSGAPPQFQRPAQGNPPPGAPPQFQRPAQANPAPGAPPQFQRPAQNNGASGPPQQFQRPAQNAPLAPAPAPQAQGNFAPGSRPGAPAFAARHGGAAPMQFNGGRFYGHDYAHFSPREAELWHRGSWHREFHDGRLGWWYVVDGIWYFYPQPIYPYPTFIPDVVYIPDVDEAPADDVDQPPLPDGVYYYDGAYYYYYCPDSQAYYPYAPSCDVEWQLVPATPQQ